MWRRLLTSCALVLLGACAGTGDARHEAAALAIVGADIVPMTTDTEVLRDQTLIIAGQRIAAIGPRASTPVPPGARVVDGRGRWLVPGLADMHVHLEHIEDPRILGLFVAAGVTLVRNMDGRPFILDWRREVATGRRVGPTIVSAGPIVDGSPPLRPDHLAVAEAADVDAVVGAQAAQGYDFVKVYDMLSPPAYRALHSAARARGLAVAGHVPRGVGLAEALQTQQVEHLTSLGRWLEAADSPFRGRFHWSKLFLAQPLDTTRVAPLARELAASGAWITPTMGVAERGLGTPAQVAGWAAEDAVQRLPAAVRAAWLARVQLAGRRMDAADWAMAARGAEQRRQLLAALSAAGVRLLAGTDTPNAFLAPGASLHLELEAFVDAGLTPGRALAAATREPAKALSQAGRWGTIVPGARADLLLTAGNPLADIGQLRRIEGLVLRGRWFDAPALRAMAGALDEARD